MPSPRPIPDDTDKQECEYSLCKIRRISDFSIYLALLFYQPHIFSLFFAFFLYFFLLFSLICFCTLGVSQIVRFASPFFLFVFMAVLDKTHTGTV